MSRSLVVVLVSIALAGCFTPMRQSDVHLNKSDVDKSEPPRSDTDIPAPVIVTPALPRPKPALRPETYSVVVSNVRVQELLFALARDAKLNVDIHPGINGTVTLNAIDQTLPQLLNRISKQADIRWEIDGPNLSVMPDTPYLRLYKVDYVNMERTSTGSVSVAAQIATTGGQAGGGAGGAAAGGAGAAAGNASSLVIRNTSTNKFWATLIDNVQDLLRETDKIFPGNAPGSAATPQQAQIGAAALPPGAIPGAPPAPNVQFREAASVIANAESGVLSIRASGRQHERIQEFLDQVLVNAKRQVLIEGTIVEVTLSNQYQQGIDWSILSTGLGPFRIFQGLSQPGAGGTLTATPTGSIFTGSYSSRNFNTVIRLLETFGNVRVLSSPRLSVLNNQTAILKVVDNVVYFTISSTVSQAANAGTLATFTTTPNVVPVGFVMNITPQISDASVVTLNLKPTISRVINFVQDPNPLLTNPCLASGTNAGGNCNIAPVISRVPQIQTRELESLLKVSDGQIAVMGGLIQDAVANSEDLIPGVDRIPVVGNVFGNRNLQSTKTELVIFLRPVVVKDASIDGDYRGYRVLLPESDFLRKPHPARRMIDPEDPVGSVKGMN